MGCTAANPDCYDSNGLSEKAKIEMKLAVAKTLRIDGWDYVPVVTDVRGVIRGTEIVEWAAQQPDFGNQQTQLQTWYDQCYGQCHYSQAVEIEQGYSIGGPMPDTPLVDIYSEGMAEAASGLIDLGMTAVLGAESRKLPEPKVNTSRFGIRITPFGYAGKGPLVSQLPHFHFRIGPYLGESYDGLGWKWHHPWEDITRLFDYLMK